MYLFNYDSLSEKYLLYFILLLLSKNCMLTWMQKKIKSNQIKIFPCTKDRIVLRNLRQFLSIYTSFPSIKVIVFKIRPLIFTTAPIAIARLVIHWKEVDLLTTCWSQGQDKCRPFMKSPTRKFGLIQVKAVIWVVF